MIDGLSLDSVTLQYIANTGTTEKKIKGQATEICMETRYKMSYVDILIG